MLKQVLLFSSVVFSTLSLQAQTVVLSEDFDNGIPATWTILKQDAFLEHASVAEFAPGWITIANPMDPTDSVAAATSYFTTSGKANRWLISPPIPLGSFGNFLKWKAMSFDPSYPDVYQVLISVTDTQISSFIDTLARVEGELDEWLEREVDLTDLGYSDQTVHIAFVLETNGGFKLMINDVEVRIDDPLSVFEQYLTQQVSIFPNPSSDMIYFSSSDLTIVSIYNTAGSLLFTQNSALPISLNEFQSGIYIVKATDSKGLTSTHRIQKN